MCVFARLAGPGLGDLVQRNIAFSLLRRAFPSAGLTVVTGATVAARFAEFFGRHSYATGVLPCPDPGEQDPRGWARFSARLAEIRPQACFVDPDSKGLGAAEARRAGIPVRLGVPAPGDGEGDLTHPLRLPRPLFGRPDLFDHAAALAAALDLPGPLRPAEAVPPLPRSGEPPPELGPAAPRLAVHPGGSSQWNRRWPLGNYAELCRLAARHTGAVCYLFGDRSERDDLHRLAEAIAAHRPGTGAEVVADAALDRTANLLAEMDLLLGNDSSLAHVAAAVRTPAVVLYGPTGTEFLWARVYPHHTGVSLRYPCQSATNPAAALAARSCEHDCALAYVSADGPYPKCLADLSVDRVWAAVSRRLGQSRAARIEAPL
ncbi:glycosyltransferase family 9 protein [Amycolatopsis sp. M39]|nr:glycosyltransferase family 9 protein [Amycolatopsis sp. M39]